MTFSGVCVLQSKLQKFEDAWSGLLRDYQLKSLHMARASRLAEKHGPRMPRGQTADQRMDALLPFADCINNHLDVGLIQAWDIKGFNALSKDARHKLGSPDDPYYVAFARGLVELCDQVQPDDYIQLFCDDDRETAWDCYRHYRGIGNANPAVFKKVASLTFADDQHFPALQAADMVAFLSRLEAKSRFYGDRYDFRRLFNYLTTKKHMQWFEMSPTKLRSGTFRSPCLEDRWPPPEDERGTGRLSCPVPPPEPHGTFRGEPTSIWGRALR